MKEIIYWKTIKESKWRWLLEALYNIVFLALIYLGILFSGKMIEKSNIIGILEQISTLSTTITGQTGEVSLLVDQFNQAFSIIKILIVGTVLYLILCYSATEYFVYKNIYKKKFSWKKMLIYTLFNIISASVMAAVIYPVLLVVKQTAAPFVVTAVILLFVYFFTFFNLIFFKEEKVFKALKLVYLLTITKFHRLTVAFGWIILALIIPYTIVYLISLLWYGIIWIIPVIFLLWIMFNRHYLKNVLDSKNIKDVFKN